MAAEIVAVMVAVAKSCILAALLRRGEDGGELLGDEYVSLARVDNWDNDRDFGGFLGDFVI